MGFARKLRRLKAFFVKGFWQPHQIDLSPKSSRKSEVGAMEEERWYKFFKKAGIPKEVARVYGATFFREGINFNMLKVMNKDHLKQLGISSMSHQLMVLTAIETYKEENRTSKSGGGLWATVANVMAVGVEALSSALLDDE